MFASRLLRLFSALVALTGPATAGTPVLDLLKPGLLLVASSDGLLPIFTPANIGASAAFGMSIGTPVGLAFGPDGRVYVTSSDSELLVVLSENGVQQDTLALSVGAEPAGVALGPDGLLWVLDDAADELFRLNVAGAAKGALPLPPGDYAGCALAFGPDGHVFVVEHGSGVLELTPGGELLRTLGAAALSNPSGLALGADGRLYVADDDDVVVLDGLGEELDRFGEGELVSAVAVALGPDGHVYVADAGAPALVEFAADGDHLDTFGGQDVSAPAALAFVPWRYVVKIKGDIAQPGDTLAKVKEQDAVLSLMPGSGTLMIALTDDVTQDDDLASVFGTSLIVLRGFEAFEGAGAAARLFHGAQADDPALTAGLGSLALRVIGQHKSGQFVPKKAKGTLHRAGVAGIYSATVKTGKSLD